MAITNPIIAYRSPMAAPTPGIAAKELATMAIPANINSNNAQATATHAGVFNPNKSTLIAVNIPLASFCANPSNIERYPLSVKSCPNAFSKSPLIASVANFKRLPMAS